MGWHMSEDENLLEEYLVGCQLLRAKLDDMLQRRVLNPHTMPRADYHWLVDQLAELTALDARVQAFLERKDIEDEAARIGANQKGKL
jgi:hypothetical protein